MGDCHSCKAALQMDRGEIPSEREAGKQRRNQGWCGDDHHISTPAAAVPLTHAVHRQESKCGRNYAHEGPHHNTVTEPLPQLVAPPSLYIPLQGVLRDWKSHSCALAERKEGSAQEFVSTRVFTGFLLA